MASILETFEDFFSNISNYMSFFSMSFIFIIIFQVHLV